MKDCTWKYAILKEHYTNGVWYRVCEEYDGLGHSGEVSPCGESVEELIRCLQMMLYDIKNNPDHIIEAN